MNCQTIPPDTSIALFVKQVWIFEETDLSKNTSLPFFADGYPGLMFQDTGHGLFVHPHRKQMPALFLYGQTIQPIQLEIKGRFSLIVFQLYPFILESFFGVPAKDINDNCYDLTTTDSAKLTAQLLTVADSFEKRIAILGNLLHERFLLKKQQLDLPVREAIQLIIDSKGKIPVSTISKKIHLTSRTLERRFTQTTGISAKQFSTIIQFQESLMQLNLKEFTRLTDIVYSNGFADQSHFIRVFKAFTGKTPKKFLAAHS